MANKAAAAGVALGGLALLGLIVFSTKEAKAKGKGKPVAVDEDMASPEACAAYEKQLNIMQGHIANLVHTQSQIANAQIGAAQAGDTDSMNALAAQMQQVTAALNKANAQASELHNLLANCE